MIVPLSLTDTLSNLAFNVHFVEWWFADSVRAGYYRLLPIRHVEAGSITVGVAQLDNDADGGMERLIITDLEEIKWVRLLPIPRTISLSSTDRLKRISDGHAQALKYLRESGAQILVWGTVLDDGNRKMPELFISFAPNPATGLTYGRYQLDDKFYLPPVFGKQLASVLDLVVASESVRFLANENPAIADELKPFITNVRQLLANTEGDPGWDAKTRVDVENALAQALWAEADVSNSTKPLEQAVVILDAITKTYESEKDWRRLAAAKQLSGLARFALVRRETLYGALSPLLEPTVRLNVLRRSVVSEVAR